MNADERDRFDELLERELARLPPDLRDLLQEAPLVIEDHPSPQLLRELGPETIASDELCGLHTGIPLTERSVHHTDLETIHLFRDGIVAMAGGFDDDALAEQIRITLLHEIGHHFGLDEDDLEALGYG